MLKREQRYTDGLMEGKRIVLVVVGLQGSGKSLAADMLKRRGFEVIEIGDIWRELLKKNNIPRSDIKGTREFTMKLREKYGKDIYAKYVVKRIRKNMRRVAIMGVRSTYEAVYLKKKIEKLYIISLLAPLKLRFNRMRHRGKPEDPKTMENFKWLEERSKRGFMKAKSEEKHGIMQIMKDADYVISNTSTVKKLKEPLARVLNGIKKQNN